MAAAQLATAGAGKPGFPGSNVDFAIVMRPYPAMQAIIAHFNNGYEAAIAAISRATDADFAAPNPAEGRPERIVIGWTKLS